jgi:hypothetical protein
MENKRRYLMTGHYVIYETLGICHLEYIVSHVLQGTLEAAAYRNQTAC